MTPPLLVSTSRLLAALWLGGGAVLLAIAAPAAFRGAGDPTHAASIVGDMLGQWRYLAIGAPAILLVISALRRGRRGPMILIGLALLMAFAQMALDARIHKIRAESLVPISALEKSDPVRRHFGMLHGASSGLMLLQIVAAAAFVWIEE
jgi:uncharacterized membrane protein